MAKTLQESGDHLARYRAKIKVVGVGGGGGNALNRMVESGIKGVEFIAVNTDAVDLQASLAPTKIQIGPKLTKGLGAGGDNQTGRKAAEESREDIAAALDDTDLLFITAGMGGGTGTGAAAVVAEVAKQMEILTIAIVTKPFSFEGSVRGGRAEEGLNDLMKNVDTLINIPNDRLLTVCDHRVSVYDAFMTADEVLMGGVQAIAGILTTPGEMNRDFADVKAIMNKAGQAWMAIGKGSGPNRSIDAAKAAVSSPLLDVSIEGAKGVLMIITGDDSLGLHEMNEAAEIVRSCVDPNANIIFGLTHDDTLKDQVKLTLVATGFSSGRQLSKQDEEEVRQKLTELKEEDKLDTPTFLRHPFPQHRRQPAAPPQGQTVRPGQKADAPQYGDRKFARR
ncbi:MAG: cell division protein FtsZ [Dehalococcoidia bacterium]|nr:cell division protein FtsZ [Dehalococcoidia bacterium]